MQILKVKLLQVNELNISTRPHFFYGSARQTKSILSPLPKHQKEHNVISYRYDVIKLVGKSVLTEISNLQVEYIYIYI